MLRMMREGVLGQETSAAGWARNTDTRRKPWRKQGYKSKYHWLQARATEKIVDASVGCKTPPKSKYAMPHVQITETYRGGLFDMVGSYPFLKRAADLLHFRSAPGEDGEASATVFQADDAYDSTITAIRRALKLDKYEPGPVRKLTTCDGRVLSIPNTRDRVVGRAVADALVPWYEPRFLDCSLGFRPGISRHHAVRLLERLCSKWNRYYLMKMDLSKAFDRVPHDRLMQAVRCWVKDDRLLRLIKLFLGRPKWQNLQGKKHVGLAMGCPLSPVLFNVYVHETIDRVVQQRHPKIVYLRWADDILLLAEDRQQAEEHVRALESLLIGAGFVLNRDKMADPKTSANLAAGEEVEFLGFSIAAVNANTPEARLKLNLPTSTWDSLQFQIISDLFNGCAHTVGLDFQAKAEAISHMVEMRVAGWVEAFVPCISSGNLSDLRKSVKTRLKALFQMASGADDVVGELLKLVHIPSSKRIAEMWRRARSLWEARRTQPIPDVYERLRLRRRAATVKPTQSSCQCGDFLEDGTDIVPVPSSTVDPFGTRRPGVYQCDWRVEPVLGEGEGVHDVPALPSDADVLIVTDGASRGNPGRAAWAYIMEGSVAATDAQVMPSPATSNVAEYHGVIAGLTAAFEAGVKRIELRSDSQVVVQQLTGTARPKNSKLLPLFSRARELMEQIARTGGSVYIRHVGRAHTEAADELANDALGDDAGY